MSDNIKEITDICKSVSAGYMIFLSKEISHAKVIKCLEQKSFASLSDDELLSIKDVSEFLARAFIEAQDSLNSLVGKDIDWAHGLPIAVVISLEIDKRGLFKDEFAKLKDVVIRQK